MDEYQNQVLRVEVCMELKASDRGGRLTPIADKYRPNIKVNGIDGYAGFVLGEGMTMAPGECRVIELIMVGSVNFLAEVRRPDQEFTVFEGSRDVGRGSIIRTLESSTR